MYQLTSDDDHDCSSYDYKNVSLLLLQVLMDAIQVVVVVLIVVEVVVVVVVVVVE